MRNLLLISVVLFTCSALAEEPRPLFDGKSLLGWNVRAGEEKWWKAAGGAIIGGSFTEDVPHNTFLATTESFGDFELVLKIRVRSGGGFANSGIQIRSTRVPNTHEMRGYQVDAGPGWWGKLYDESRRDKVIGEPHDPKAIEAAIKPEDWNEYRIRAEGPTITSWINGVAALDYTEADPSIPRDGQIGIQVHKGGKALIEVKDVSIRRLPPKPAGAPQSAVPPASLPLSAQEEAKHFALADGFTAELVLEESTSPANPYGKFVALAFDSHGRLWTTTAIEYPVDANENPEASRRLFASGGRDKVLVIDEPCAEKPTARVFADGLAMPLGVLPYHDGAFVQYGTEIRFYRDTDGDGQADSHTTVLEGFGVEDSHLFPHQFTRAPGGWILMAQGLFNKSSVRRPDGAAFADGRMEVPFDACKLARFRADGSAFEPLTAGPNNIWGLTISRMGQTWLQEANDLGYSIFPYEPGVLVSTGSPDRLRPYQPMMPPPMGTTRMGGTGLSGLALADDLDGWPAPWGVGAGATPAERIFYVANPITNSIQSIIATRSGERFTYRKGPDLLTSTDKAFRPVAIQFGPDGCLYVVDWYNKIISHNEVPRTHPDRDRIRGRIWRIRHASQARHEPAVLAQVSTHDLPRYLGATNARIADCAWQEIIDRDARSLVPHLERLAADAKASADARLGALWALEGLAAATTPLLEQLAADRSADLRHEAIRIAAAICSENDFRRLAVPLVDDPSPRVRAALGDSLRRVPAANADTLLLMMRLGRGRSTGDALTAYDRDFERYLARWALEMHAAEVASLLDSPAGKAMPMENRILATLSLDPRTAATRLAGMIAAIDRPFHEEEVYVLANQADDPTIASALARLTLDPKNRATTLRHLLKVRPSITSDALGPIAARATAALFRESTTDSERLLAVELAGAFKIRALEPEVVKVCRQAAAGSPERRAAIRSLREVGSLSAETGRALMEEAAKDPPFRADVLDAWAHSRDPAACVALLKTWDQLDHEERQKVAMLLARQREGAAALVAAVAADDIDAASLPLSAIVDLRVVLPEEPVLEKLWADIFASAPQVLRLTGKDGDAVGHVSLDGPFTVEAWANFEAPIGHEDSLLSKNGLIDMNFDDGLFRVWTMGRDIVVAKSKTVPDTWTHYAVTRGARGTFRIYIDGEFEAESITKETSAYPNLWIGASTSQGGTRGRIAEFRVWNRARSADEIRADFDRSYAKDGERPPSLMSFHGGGSWGTLSGEARIEPAIDGPRLVTTAELLARNDTFTRFRELAMAAGDPTKGRDIFASRCLACHQQGGQGGRVGPALDGLGLTGIEAILRNVLTPNAAMEGGYRAFRVITRDGRIVQGLLVSRDADAIVIRQPGMDDIRIPSRDVDRADFTGVSVMPEGLLESMPPQEVSDLFAHLKSLGNGTIEAVPQ